MRFISVSLYLLNRIICSCWCFERWSDATYLGKSHDHHKYGCLTDDFMPKAPTITARTLTVSASPEYLAVGLMHCFQRLQTVLHSVLSTRIVLHTAKVLRQDVVGSHATVTQNRWLNSIRFAEVTADPAPEEVELQETWK